jgi:hypothetical protein
MRGSLTLTTSYIITALFAAGACLAEPNLEWSELYDGGGNYLDVGNAALCDPDGNLVVAGESADGIDGTDMLIRKLERGSSETLWSERYAAFDGNDMALTDMIWDPSGDLLIAGYIRGCEG